jgi:hypothetical protein
MLDSMCESDCFWVRTGDPGLIIIFGCINKYECPEATEDDYYISVWIGEEDGKRIPHRISLVEPKYIYGSDPLPMEYRDKVISLIISNYSDGINAINEYEGEDGEYHFDPDAMPNYDLL